MTDDLSPGVWPIVRSRGDGFTPTAFSVEVDDIPVAVTGALAQVRRRRDRTSTLIFTPTIDLSGNVVTVGDYETLEPIAAGSYWWDLQVWDGTRWTADRPLTLVGGSFRLVEDVTHV